MKLSKRLQVIAGLIEKGASVADIGTDHGYLPVYLVQSGLYRKIIASDINASALVAARRSAEDADVTDSIKFIVAPGLDEVIAAEVDTVVISGLGGEMISGILSDTPWTKQREIKLILQPQSKIDILFRFLYDNGYEIKQIKSVLDREKYYTVILATGGTT